MITKILIASLGGLAGHQSRRFTRNMEPGWRNLIEHAVGGALLMPFVVLFLDTDDKTQNERVTFAYVTALFSVGAGVALGWIIDSLSWSGNGK